MLRISLDELLQAAEDRKWLLLVDTENMLPETRKLTYQVEDHIYTYEFYKKIFNAVYETVKEGK